MDGEREFEEGLEELAEDNRKLREGEEDEPREERGREVDLQFLREVMYGLEAVSIGTHQLLYFSAMKYVKKSMDVEADGFEDAVEQLADIFDSFNLGTLEVADAEEMELRLSENAITYNAPESGRTMCYYISGYIAGFLEKSLDGNYVVNETGCSAEGNEACTFKVQER